MNRGELRISLDEADTWANAILDLIMRGVDGERQETCLDGMVVGTVRRREPTVSSIDLVLLPIEGVVVRPLVYLNRTIDFLCSEGWVGRDATPYGNTVVDLRSVSAYSGLRVRLHLASEANFGNICAIRTGDPAFARAFSTNWRSMPLHVGASFFPGGLMPDFLKMDDGFLWWTGLSGLERELTPCRTEEAFFRQLKLPVVDPPLRTAKKVTELRRELRVPAAQ